MPLISLNKYSFGPAENFRNAYLSKDHRYIIVELGNTDPDYCGMRGHGHDLYAFSTATQIVFYSPAIFMDDIAKVVRGEYSQLSAKAKEMIRLFSALNYMKKIVNADGKKETLTDARLLALDRDELLRARMEWLLNVDIAVDSELLSAPKDTELVEINAPAQIAL